MMIGMMVRMVVVMGATETHIYFSFTFWPKVLYVIEYFRVKPPPVSSPEREGPISVEPGNLTNVFSESDPPANPFDSAAIYFSSH